MLKILAIDFGLKRCGIAITDELRIIASPLCTVESKNLEIFLKEKIDSKEVGEIVIGLPLNSDGQATNITQNVHLLKEHLQNKYPAVVIALHDERFTSKMASAAMFDSGMKKRKREVKGNVDMTSAAIILQGYMRSKE